MAFNEHFAEDGRVTSGEATLIAVAVDALIKILEFNTNCQFFTSNAMHPGQKLSTLPSQSNSSCIPLYFTLASPLGVTQAGPVLSGMKTGTTSLSIV
jgi:hypothetical protein